MNQLLGYPADARPLIINADRRHLSGQQWQRDVYGVTEPRVCYAAGISVYRAMGRETPAG